MMIMNESIIFGSTGTERLSCTTAATAIGPRLRMLAPAFALRIELQLSIALKRLLTFGTIICNMAEKQIEYRLRDKIKLLGGIAWKLVCPGFTGVPDRLVLMPGGRVFFVELKNGNKGVLSARQVIVHKFLNGLGFKVWIVKDEETLQEFLNAI